MDTGKTTALVLLDLSAAFDTSDHSSIIELLSGWYGISGTALNCVRSYLSNRVQRVKLLDKLGEPFKTDYGVSARNLGVEFDKDFNLKKHISKICRSCYYHIRDLRRLRRCLTAAVTKTIATSLVSNKLDYCNSIIYNIPNREINKVQSVHNCLARVVTRSPRFCSVTPLLKSLH